MQAILNIKANEVDNKLLNVIKELLSRNIEIIIKKSVELEEFDKSISLDNVMQEFGKSGYSKEFLRNLKVGFETSEIYAGRNESKVSKR